MNVNILSIILFSPIFNSRNKIVKSNQKAENSSKKRVERLKGKFNTEKALKLIETMMLGMHDSNKTIAIGRVISSLFEYTSDNVLHRRNKINLVHYNQSLKISDYIKILETTSHIGHGHNRTISKFLRGPVCQKYSRNLKDSSIDYISPVYRSELKMKSGVNQKSTIFLGKDTFLTLEDLWQLADGSNQFKESIWLKRTKKPKKSTENSHEDVPSSKSYQQNKFSTKTSCLLNNRIQLSFYNSLPTYACNIKLSLCRIKSTDELAKIIDKIIPNNNKRKTRTILEDELLHVENFLTSNTNFMERKILTTISCDPLKCDEFCENVTICKSWFRKLNTESKWVFNLHESHFDGINLNKLYDDLIIDKRSGDCPASFFFVVQAWGDKNGLIQRDQDSELFAGVVTPVMLNCEFKVDINYVGKSNINESDNILSYNHVENKNFEFENDEMGNVFHPTREIRNFNIDFDDVYIPNRKNNTKTTFKLVTNEVVPYQEGDLEKLIEKVKTVDEELANQLTEDDLDFVDSNTKSNEIEEELFGNLNNEFNEDDDIFDIYDN